MGWFGKTVMAGDEPMDYESEIREVCGLSFDMDDEGLYKPPITKELLEKHQSDIYEKFKNDKVTIIAFQVLAAMMVENGATFEPHVLEKCKECIKKDDWAELDIERKYHMDFLLNVLENYDNTPTEYQDEKIFKPFGEFDKKHYNYVFSVLLKLLTDNQRKIIRKIGSSVIGIYEPAIHITIHKDNKNWHENFPQSEFFGYPLTFEFDDHESISLD